MKKIALAFVLVLFVSLAYGENPKYLGESAPAFQVGRFVNDFAQFSSLEDLKGDVVLVEFFRTSCPPCRAAMAHLEKTFNTITRPDFHIIASTQDSYNLVERFLYHHVNGVGVNYPVAVESKANWGVTGVPMAYIVGRDGKVVWAGNPNTPFEKSLEEALAVPAPGMPEVPKKFLKTMLMLAEEDYSGALRDCAKAAEKPETADFGKYIEELVKKYHDQYIFKVDTFMTNGDIYKAQTLLEKLAKKFKGTPYEIAIKDRIKPLKDEKEGRDAYKLFKEFHEIAASARTGKKSSIDEAIAVLEKFIQKNENYKVAEPAKALLAVLKNPWNEQEALR